jgi:multiple sugar transport system permease protein
MKAVRWAVILLYASVSMLPLVWLGLTSLKTKEASIDPAARFLPALEAEPEAPRFEASLGGYQRLGEPFAGTQNSFYHYLGNSVIIGIVSTAVSVALGTVCAYGFSRFRVAGARDWLFFILSTRFMPPLAVVAPILLMYRQFDLQNTHLGLIVLYTGFNLSLAVWLMKGFIDDIPRAYEEAALMDGYSRFAAFVRIILPEARTGMAVTAVFCLISAWNEYGFAMTLNNAQAVTVPVYFAGLQGNIRGIPWPQVCAGVLFFVAPIAAFTILVRHHLLRGVTFGTVKG